MLGSIFVRDQLITRAKLKIKTLFLNEMYCNDRGRRTVSFKDEMWRFIREICISDFNSFFFKPYWQCEK